MPDLSKNIKMETILLECLITVKPKKEWIIKKNEILPFATEWMNLQGIMLSEINQSEKDRCHMISFMFEK